MSKQERAIKAMKELDQLLTLWLSGKITHESAMLRVQEIYRVAK